MKPQHRPALDFVCPQLPIFAEGQKIAHCAVCKTDVHNLCAYTAAQERSLLSKAGALCVRYTVIAAAVIGVAPSGMALAQDSDSAIEELDQITVMGGRIKQVPPTNSLFLEELPESPSASTLNLSEANPNSLPEPPK
jgi:hypothetical protein